MLGYRPVVIARFVRVDFHLSSAVRSYLIVGSYVSVYLVSALDSFLRSLFPVDRYLCYQSTTARSGRVTDPPL